MNVNITLPPEIEDELLTRAAALSTDVSGFVLEAVQQKIAEAQEADEHAELSYEEWKDKFDAWIASHRSRNPSFDDSRDSIYE